VVGVSSKYSHILAPLKIGNVVLKNRLLAPPSTPHFLQGPENFPSDEMRTYYINQAKNGAGMINIRLMTNRVRRELRGDSAHMIIYDIEDYGVQNYLDQLTEGIHLYGSKAFVGLQVGMGGGPSGARGGAPGGAAMPGGAPPGAAAMPGGAPGGAPGGEGMPAGGRSGMQQAEISAENLQQMIEAIQTQGKFYQSHGFDALQVGIRGNQKVSIELCKAAKKAMPDMLIITEIFVRDPAVVADPTDQYYQSGTNIDDAIKYAKQLEGYADIAMVRIANALYAHATTYTTTKGNYYSIAYTEAMKKAGVKLIVAAAGGYLELDPIEEYIASGKTDMITMARPFICDTDYGKKIAAGRGDDVVPCIKCNKCHGESMEGPWFTVCSVNPKVGIPLAVRSIKPPDTTKKVAVIGGGPAGMKAAITAAERGHKVTLYEKEAVLGGLLKHSDYSSYKWAVKDFKDYLISKMNRVGVEVVLNTAATPEMIKAKGYDTVLVAVGADPVLPRIPGGNGKNVYNITDAFPKEKEMGKNVVFVGGGEYGADCGIYLAKAGHNVTMLTSERDLGFVRRPHYPETIELVYKQLNNFSIITQGTARRIAEGKVFYTDANGNEKSLPADSVVLYSGLRPKKDEALKFYGSAAQFSTVGDCSEKSGNIQKTQRSAFFAASEV